MSYILICLLADETLFFNMVAGMVAGGVSSAICNPTDVLKVVLTDYYPMQERTNLIRTSICENFSLKLKNHMTREESC